MSESARILCACDWMVKYTAGLARGLSECGAQTALLTRDHDHELGGRAGAMRAYVTGMLDGQARHLVLPGRPREPRAWGDAVRARRTVRRFAPDVVHLQSTVVADPRLVAVAGPRPGRYAVTIHDVFPHPGDARPTRVGRALMDRMVRSAGVTFVHAEPLVEEARRRWGDVPLAVVPHGVDPPDPRPLPARPSLLFFGRLSAYKGLDVLLAAMPRAWEGIPELSLVVAGAGDLPSSPVLDDPRVSVRHEHVPEEELGELFGEATVVVLPYREASQSGVGAQAKRFGRGMVASAVGGLPELLADGSGVLVPPGDPDALAEVLVRVAGDPGVASRLADAARAGVEASGWRAVGERTLAAYRRFGLLR